MSWNKDKNIRDVAYWLRRKIELIEEKDRLINSNGVPITRIYRGNVFNAELGYNLGCEKSKTRPILVISKNELNRGHTVLIAPISTKFVRNPNNNLPRYKNHYLLKKSDYPSLSEDSVIKFEDIKSIDLIRLRDFRFNVNIKDMENIKRNVLFTFGF